MVVPLCGLRPSTFPGTGAPQAGSGRQHFMSAPDWVTPVMAFAGARLGRACPTWPMIQLRGGADKVDPLVGKIATASPSAHRAAAVQST